jgi:lipopolysaccharide/colanic/teichoic acid biosynthesis glycosyltransferase
MSFVGPRPEVAKYVGMYTEEEKAILRVRPGITDWASIRHCHQAELMSGSEDADRFFEEKIRKTKVRLQLFYVRNHSLWVDLKILVYTFVRIVNSRWLPPEIAHYGELE